MAGSRRRGRLPPGPDRRRRTAPGSSSTPGCKAEGRCLGTARRPPDWPGTGSPGGRGSTTLGAPRVRRARRRGDGLRRGLRRRRERRALGGRRPRAARARRRLGARPGRWQPWTPLAVFAAHHVLFATFPRKLWRRHLERRDRAGARRRSSTTRGSGRPGSNSWVVGGRAHRERDADDRRRPAPHVRVAERLPAGPAHLHRPRRRLRRRRLHLPRRARRAALRARRRRWRGGSPTRWPTTRTCSSSGSSAAATRSGRRAPTGGSRRRLAQSSSIEVRGGHARGGRGAWSPATVRSSSAGPARRRRSACATPSYGLGDAGLRLPAAAAAGPDDRRRRGGARDVGRAGQQPLVADVARRRAPAGRRAGCRSGRRRTGGGRCPALGRRQHAGRGGSTTCPHRTVPPDGHLVTANHRMGDDFDRVGRRVRAAGSGRPDRPALLDGRDDLDLARLRGDPPRRARRTAGAARRGRRGCRPARPSVTRRAACATRSFAGTSSSPRTASTAAAYVAVRDALVHRLAESPRFAGLEDPPYEHGVRGVVHGPGQIYLSLANLLSDEGRAVVPDDRAAPGRGRWRTWARDRLRRAWGDGTATSRTTRSA